MLAAKLTHRSVMSTVNPSYSVASKKYIKFEKDVKLLSLLHSEPLLCLIFFFCGAFVLCRSREILEQSSRKALALFDLQSMNHSLKRYHNSI